MDETIAGGSPVGKRLKRIPRQSLKFLVHGGKRVKLSDVMTIGRDRSNAITIDDPWYPGFTAPSEGSGPAGTSKTPGVPTAPG